MLTHYEVLGLECDASSNDVRRAYRSMMRKLHPDVAGEAGQDAAGLVNHAYTVLNDPSAKRLYDSTLPSGKPAPEPVHAEPERNARAGHQRAPQPTTTARPSEHSEVRSAAPAPLVEVFTARGQKPLLAIAGIAGIVALALTVVGGLLIPAARNDGSTTLLVYTAFVAGVPLAMLAKRFWKWAGRVLTASPVLVAITSIGSNGQHPSTASLIVMVGASVTFWASCIWGLLYSARTIEVRRAQSWRELLNAAQNDPTGQVFWVAEALFDGAQSQLLLQRMEDANPSVSITVFGNVSQGSWIAVNDGGHVITSADNEAPVAHQKLSAA
jgi:hypothetical protein